jgi:hypothetical protein
MWLIENRHLKGVKTDLSVIIIIYYNATLSRKEPLQ